VRINRAGTSKSCRSVTPGNVSFNIYRKVRNGNTLNAVNGINQHGTETSHQLRGLLMRMMMMLLLMLMLLVTTTTSVSATTTARARPARRHFTNCNYSY